MKWQEMLQELLGWLRKWLWHCFPKASLRWRNGALWRVAGFRWGVRLAMTVITAFMVALVQWLLHESGWRVSPIALRNDLIQEVHKLKSLSLQAQSNATAQNLLWFQKKAALHEMSEQVDTLVAHWPNSAMRMPLLSQLQAHALQMGLQVIELKALPSPDVHGFESSRVHLQMKGTEQATYAYWQNLDQVFANGLWPNLSWTIQPDGQYLLAAQLHLWWDADDALTDTGVEVRWLDSLIKKPVTQPALAHDFSIDFGHVFPNQSHAHMKLVGSADSGSSAFDLSRQPPQMGWALVKSGQQVLPVRSGQYLGSERSKIHFANEQGLWGEMADGPAQKLLTWEANKP